MNKTKSSYILLMLALLIGSVSCSREIRLKTQWAQEEVVSGNYTAIYYGCNFLNDLETIAFLEKEGSMYHFEPFAPDSKFRVKKRMSAKEALETAKKAVNCNAQFSSALVMNILAPNGETIGYEVRPLYLPYRYGTDDILDVDYRLKDNKVVITIRLRASVEMGVQENKRRLGDKDMGRGREK